MAISHQDVMEDLAYMEAEGPADMMEEEADFAEEDYGEEDAWDNADMGDAYEEGDGMEAEESEESVNQTLGSMLSAEEEDEFIGKLFSGAKSLLQKAAPWVGKIARGAAPILSMIPHPAAQAAAQIANVAGKLRAEGGSVEDALEAVAEIAARDPRALPLVAGLAARTVLKNRGASMPAMHRQNAARAMTRAVASLVRSGGPQAIRALPKIAKSVRRTAASRGTPPAVRPQVVARTAAKVARNPSVLRRLSAPSPIGRAMLRRSAVGGVYLDPGYGDGMPYANGGGRTMRVSGPATITIHVG